MRLLDMGRWTSFPRRASLAGGLAAVLLFTAAVPVGAQTVEQTEVPPALFPVPTLPAAVPASPELVIEGNTLRLQLEDAIALALRRNLDISIERFNREQSLLGIRSGRGIYDLQTNAELRLRQVESPSTAVVEGQGVIDSDSRSANLGFSQLTPWGGVARFQLFSSRTSSTSENVLFNPQYFSQSDISFTQPLLEGFGYTVTNQAILVARINSDINLELFEQQVSTVLLQVEQAYWSLVEAREQLVVAQESLELAQDLHERNRIQVEVGTLAPIELVQSEATIAQRQEDIITAEARLRDASDELLRLLNLPDAMAEGLDVLPLTDPEAEALDIDVEQAIRVALEERPEVRSQQLAVERLEVDLKVARNRTLPQLDLVTGYGAEGRGGVGTLRTGPDPDDLLVVDTDLEDALQDVVDQEFTGWTVGLNFAFPIQNRQARAQRSIAALELEQARAELDQLTLGIITEVRSAARAVRTALQQIESARITRRLQERNLEAEQKRYENGMSDSFRISQIQNDLTGARSREVSAVTNYRTQLVNYYQATGRLLEQEGVELVGPGSEYQPREERFSLFGLFDF